MASSVTKAGSKPRKLTPAMEAAFISAIRLGATYESALAAAGIDRQTLRRWRQLANAHPGCKHAKFFEAVSKASAEAETLLLDTLHHHREGDNAGVSVQATVKLLDRLDRRAGERLTQDELRHRVVSPLWESVQWSLRRALLDVRGKVREGMNGHAADPEVARLLTILEAATGEDAVMDVLERVSERANELIGDAYK